MAVFVKDPDSRVDYTMDWGVAYLGDQHIVSSNWAVSPQSADAPVIEGSSHDGRKTAVTLSGGAIGKVYDITNRVMLGNAERVERSISIQVEQQ